MSELKIDPKKRYNVFLKHPVLGIGEPGQMGHYDMSAEEAQKLIEKGVVERVSVKEFNNSMISREQAAKNRKRFAPRATRRR